jgi:phosphoribosyl 1,2-cyclic phosphodiesterase
MSSPRPDVRVKIWGCRGSVPTPGPETVRYGGNTSCVEVSLDDGAALVLDAGTGIRPLGVELLERGTRRVDLVLTHLHLDHLEGLRFFAPLWDERVTINIWGPPSPLLSLQERISRSFSPPLFPIDLGTVPARVAFHDVSRERWAIDGVSLATDLVVHPGPTIGLRVEGATSSIAYMPDHEPALAGGVANKSRDWISGASLAGDVDVLLHDAQYFEQEYEDRIGWGHSSVAEAVAFSRALGVRRLFLFHHEPAHGDGVLERLEGQARSFAGADEVQPTLAREGMVIELP